MALRLASTVMLLRDIDVGQGVEVFMVRRAVQSEFMPDLYVFPGGAVTSDDSAVERAEGICRPVDSPANDVDGQTALGSGVRAAAIRELFEEANVLLAYADGAILALDEETSTRFAEYRRAFNSRSGSLVEMAQAEKLVLATDRLAYFAHWITPEGMPKRFDAHFFLATAPTEQEAIYDQLETSEGVWIQPGEALERFNRREFPIAFPTFHQLRDLAGFASIQQAVDAAATRAIPAHQPLVTRKDDRMHVYLPEAPDYLWRVS